MARNHISRYASQYTEVGYSGIPTDGLRQKIEHAGYSRYILEKKPARYNDYGDEFLDYGSEEEPDTHAADIDPYEGIRLEGAPLHPTPHEA